MNPFKIFIPADDPYWDRPMPVKQRMMLYTIMAFILVSTIVMFWPGEWSGITQKISFVTLMLCATIVVYSLYTGIKEMICVKGEKK